MNHEVHRVSEGVSEKVALIRRRLGEWNATRAPIAWEEEIVLEVRGDDGEMMGGLVASVWGAVMELEFLWVAEAMRGEGVGSDLLRRGEAIAAERGCQRVVTSTYSFQAPGLYRKFGYVVELAIGGFPEGIRKEYYVKELDGC